MCVVSMVHDSFRQKIPLDWWKPTVVNPDPLETLNLLKDIMKKLEEIDKRLGQPDCVDPEKAKYLDDVKKAIENYQNSGKLPE